MGRIGFYPLNICSKLAVQLLPKHLYLFIVFAFYFPSVSHSIWEGCRVPDTLPKYLAGHDLDPASNTTSAKSNLILHKQRYVTDRSNNQFNKLPNEAFLPTNGVT